VCGRVCCWFGGVSVQQMALLCVWDSLCGFGGVSVCCVWDSFAWDCERECMLCVGEFGMDLGK